MNRHYVHRAHSTYTTQHISQSLQEILSKLSIYKTINVWYCNYQNEITSRNLVYIEYGIQHLGRGSYNNKMFYVQRTISLFLIHILLFITAKHAFDESVPVDKWLTASIVSHIFRANLYHNNKMLRNLILKKKSKCERIFKIFFLIINKG